MINIKTELDYNTCILQRCRGYSKPVLSQVSDPTPHIYPALPGWDLARDQQDLAV